MAATTRTLHSAQNDLIPPNNFLGHYTIFLTLSCAVNTTVELLDLLCVPSPYFYDKAFILWSIFLKLLWKMEDKHNFVGSTFIINSILIFLDQKLAQIGLECHDKLGKKGHKNSKNKLINQLMNNFSSQNFMLLLVNISILPLGWETHMFEVYGYVLLWPPLFLTVPQLFLDPDF